MLDRDALAAHVETVRPTFHGSWHYGSRASVPHKYVAMPLGKVACSTLKFALQTFEGCSPGIDEWWKVHDGDAGPTLMDHPTDVVVEMLTSPDYLRFAFVRNPYDRLLSAWKSKFLVEDDEGYAPHRQRVREAFDHPTVDGRRVGRIAFREAVEFMLSEDERDDGHWSPQVDGLLLDVIDYDVIGRFERFSDDLTAILERLQAPAEVLAIARQRINETSPIPLVAAYDTVLARTVHDHYAADFERFGYEADSWRFA